MPGDARRQRLFGRDQVPGLADFEASGGFEKTNVRGNSARSSTDHVRVDDRSTEGESRDLYGRCRESDRW